jgi:hypothetical protein
MFPLLHPVPRDLLLMRAVLVPARVPLLQLEPGLLLAGDQGHRGGHLHDLRHRERQRHETVGLFCQ